MILTFYYLFYIYNTKEYPELQYFDLKFEPHGFSQFINKTELYSKSEENDKSIIEDNKIVVGVYIRIFKGDSILVGNKTNMNILFSFFLCFVMFFNLFFIIYSPIS